MRKKILSIALAVMMAIPTMPVMAASDKDVLGDWYANIYGVGIQVTFRKGGSYLISMDGVNNGDPEEGTWKMTGDAITLDEGEENSMNLTVKGNSISADNGEFTLSREETEYDGYTPAKVVDADEKDFDGIWKADYVSTGNITAPVDVFGISGVFISVKSGKLELFLNSDVYEKPLDAEDLTVEFKDNTCTFTSEKDEEKDEEKENLKFANSQEKKKENKPVEKEEETIKQLVLPDSLTIKELADKMKVQPSVVVKKLFMQGKIVTINQEVDYDTAEEIALEFNCICEHEEKVDVIAELLKEDDEAEDTQVTRPPVVCVMGHVDHGKTSLLDAIRHTNVIDREAGGITQHIGAYVVEINGEKITFLDTPGHEAFTAMRMRGASSTDIAVLVVAADDGVMPQTVEAINHAKAAGVEIIVAVNKMDKPSANIDRVKQELTEYELIPEDWGGSTIFVPVSAKTGEGLEDLMEMIALTAEVMELKANPNRRARGLVLEAKLDKGRGSVANILVQKGTLRVGDPIAAGSAFGKVRAMMDDKGRRVKEAGPSTPVEILGDRKSVV